MERLTLRLAIFALIMWGLSPAAQGQRFAATGTPTSGSGLAAPSEHEAIPPTAGEVIARMLEMNRERLAALQHYESQRTYRVEYHGTGGEHHAELLVRIVYTGPNQKQFTVVSESGPKFLRDEVLRKLAAGEQEASGQANRMQTTLGPENYDAQLAGEELLPDTGSASGAVRTWVLHVSPKVDNKFTYRGTVWVSQDDYAVVKIVGEPAKSPSWWIDHAHFKSMYLRRGEVWLPEKNVSSSHVRIGGVATLTIEYGSYPEVKAKGLKVADAPAEIAAREHDSATER